MTVIVLFTTLLAPEVVVGRSPVGGADSRGRLPPMHFEVDDFSEMQKPSSELLHSTSAGIQDVRSVFFEHRPIVDVNPSALAPDVPLAGEEIELFAVGPLPHRRASEDERLGR